MKETQKQYPAYIRNYMLQLEARKYPLKTIQAYTSALLTMCSRLGKTPEQIGRNTLASYVAGIKSVSYHKQTVGSFAKYFEVVVGKKINTAFIPYPRAEHRIPDILTPEECYRLFMAIDNLKHRSEIQTGYCCALRIGEIARIQIKDITGGPSPMLKVTQSKGKRDRQVPVPADLITLWRSYLKAHHQGPLTPDTYLFPGQKKGEHISHKSISNVLDAGMKRARICKDITIHTLRHSRATHWHNAGIDIKKIKDLLGHKHLRTTEIYLHTGIEDIALQLAAADQLIKLKINRPQPQKLTA